MLEARQHFEFHFGSFFWSMGSYKDSFAGCFILGDLFVWIDWIGGISLLIASMFSRLVSVCFFAIYCIFWIVLVVSLLCPFRLNFSHNHFMDCDNELWQVQKKNESRSIRLLLSSYFFLVSSSFWACHLLWKADIKSREGFWDACYVILSCFVSQDFKFFPSILCI